VILQTEEAPQFTLRLFGRRGVCSQSCSQGNGSRQLSTNGARAGGPVQRRSERLAHSPKQPRPNLQGGGWEFDSPRLHPEAPPSARLSAPAAGSTQRLLVRDPSRAPQLPDSVIVQAAFGDPGAVRAAVEGLPTVLMVSAAEAPDRVEQHISFIDAVVAAGVEHLVYISFYGAAPTCTFTLGRHHHATEQYIRGSGLRFTFLAGQPLRRLPPRHGGQRRSQSAGRRPTAGSPR
jgi:NAD(P)H-binding